jgi:uncharacterized protein (DUF1778 family)
MKDNYLRVRLTTAEKDLIKEKANMYGMSISDYVKYCCLINPPKLKIRDKGGK